MTMEILIKLYHFWHYKKNHKNLDTKMKSAEKCAALEFLCYSVLQCISPINLQYGASTLALKTNLASAEHTYVLCQSHQYN